jgi:hypothetical protein
MTYVCRDPPDLPKFRTVDLQGIALQPIQAQPRMVVQDLVVQNDLYAFQEMLMHGQHLHLRDPSTRHFKLGFGIL